MPLLKGNCKYDTVLLSVRINRLLQLRRQVAHKTSDPDKRVGANHI